MKLYIAADTGPSGFGVASRGVIRSLMDRNEIDLTVRTHFWGLNRVGMHFNNGGFPDQRFQEELLTSGRVNDDYLIEDPREMADRNDDLLDNLSSNAEVDAEQCLIRDFEGPEDVWLAIGGVSFAEQAPDHAYSIVSTDFNLDIVPRDWEFYVNQVDEVWVPSEWTRQAILNRIPDANVRTYPYGINMQYEPTEYDCEVCPHNKQQSAGPPQRCLRDDSFNFLMISRFYHIKGLYRAIKAFVEEFRQNEDVRLMIKTTSNNQFNFNPVQAAQAVVQETGYPDPPEIGFAVESLETQYLYDLLGHCDAFIQPSRAECFGIAQLQAAYCRTPVIYTDWSAQAELLDKDNPGFIPIEDYQVERPRAESQFIAFEASSDYPPDANWATPSVEAIQERMRKVVEMDQEELDRRGSRGREHVEENFQWSDMIQPRVDRLREVTNEQ